MFRFLFIGLICAFILQGSTFNIIKSEKQPYFGGRQGTGGGINFLIEIVALKSSDKLSFDSLDFEGQKLRINVCNSKSGIIEHFSKGDTVLLKSSIKLADEELRQPGSGFFVNNAVLYYTFKRQMLSANVFFNQSDVENRF